MGRKKRKGDHSENLKIGDTVLLYFNTKSIAKEKSTQKSGYVITDLSG